MTDTAPSIRGIVRKWKAVACTILQSCKESTNGGNKQSPENTPPPAARKQIFAAGTILVVVDVACYADVVDELYGAGRIPRRVILDSEGIYMHGTDTIAYGTGEKQNAVRRGPLSIADTPQCLEVLASAHSFNDDPEQTRD